MYFRQIMEQSKVQLIYPGLLTVLNKQIYLSTFYWSNLLNISHFVSPNPRSYHLHHCYNVPQLGDYLAHITPCPTLSQDSWNMLRTFVSVLDHQSWEPASVCMTQNHFGKFRQTLIFLCTVKPVQRKINVCLNLPKWFCVMHTDAGKH